MSIVVIEGLDRTGKSSVANYYKSKGYEVVHFNKPDKKYYDKTYTSSTYLDDMVELLMSFAGRDVFLDRSHMGELIWTKVYNRKPLLTEEDIEILREIEDSQDARRILMVDDNIEAHWARCVANKEPLTRVQFNHAMQLYAEMAVKYNFEVFTLPKFMAVVETQNIPKTEAPTPTLPKTLPEVTVAEPVHVVTKEQATLERANAINDILKSKRIYKQTGTYFDDLEKETRTFLNSKLGDLLGINKDTTGLTKDDVAIVKAFVQRLKDKAK